MKFFRKWLAFILCIAILGSILLAGCSRSKITELSEDDIFIATQFVLSDDDFFVRLNAASHTPMSIDDNLLLCNRFFGEGFLIHVSSDHYAMTFLIDEEGQISAQNILEHIGDPQKIVELNNGRIFLLTRGLNSTTLRAEYRYYVYDANGQTLNSDVIFQASDRQVVQMLFDGESTIFLLLQEQIISINVDSGETDAHSIDNAGYLDFAYLTDNTFLLLENVRNEYIELLEYSAISGKTKTLARFESSDSFLPSNIHIQPMDEDARVFLLSPNGIAEFDRSDRSINILFNALSYYMTIVPEFLSIFSDGSFFLYGEMYFGRTDFSGFHKISFFEAQSKEIIKLAAYNYFDDNEVNEIDLLVYLFNSSNPYYEIELMKISVDSSMDYTADIRNLRNVLVLEVLSDEPPDMFYLPIHEMALLSERGVLLDISNTIDNALMDRQDEYFINAVEASRISGQQFFLAPFFSIVGFEMSLSHLDQIEEHTLLGWDEYARTQNIKMFSKNSFIYLMAIEAYFLEHANGFGDLDYEELIDFISLIGESSQSNHSETLTCFLQIDSFGYFLDMMQTSNEDSGLVGYPNGVVEPPMMSASMAWGANISIENVDAVEHFVEFLLSYEIQSSGEHLSYDRLPLSRVAFDHHMYSTIARMEESAHQNVQEYTTVNGEDQYVDLSSGIIRPYHRDRNWEESFVSMISRAQGLYIEDHELSRIVSEEIYPYLDGQKSLDQAVNALHSRVRIYLAEK